MTSRTKIRQHGKKVFLAIILVVLVFSSWIMYLSFSKTSTLTIIKKKESPNQIILEAAPPPPFPATGVTLSGGYFVAVRNESASTFNCSQIGGSDCFKRVDGSLTLAMWNNEKQFATSWIKFKSLNPMNCYRYITKACIPLPGDYSIEPSKNFVSASSAEISEMLPTASEFPLGVYTENWVSSTVEIPSGVTVEMQQLFKNPSSALREISFIVKNDFLKGKTEDERIVRNNDYSLGWTTVFAGIAPKYSNYNYWALTSQGLALGFSQGVLAGDDAGRIEVTVPYTKLSNYFSSLGSYLVSKVQNPIFIRGEILNGISGFSVGNVTS